MCVCQRQRERGGGRRRDMRIVKMDFDMKVQRMLIWVKTGQVESRG